MAAWPAKSQSPLGVVALPAYRDPESDPSGFVLLRTCGRKFPGVEGGPPQRGAHLAKGSTPSWIVSDRAKLADAFVVWVVEGPSDMLALSGVVPAGEVVLSASHGAASTTKLPLDLVAGKKLIVIGDCDAAGVAGAEALATRTAAVATELRIVKLPSPVSEKHGRDLRAFLNDGGTIDQLKELADAAKPLSPSKPGGIVNADEVATADSKGVVIKPRTIGQSCEDIQNITDGWPRRVGHEIFVHELDSVRWIDNQPALFSYIGSKSLLPPNFRRDSNLHTRGDAFEQLRATVESYEGISEYPHIPQLDDHYYTCAMPNPNASNGTGLAELVDRFSPSTAIARDLIVALLATLLWGGPPGARPMFLITSDDGRGTGKTKLAEIASMLCGSCIALSHGEHIETLRARLLSPEDLKRRVGLIDNIKTGRFSWAELEALVTAEVISGKAMYIGEARSPNLITFVATINGPATS